MPDRPVYIVSGLPRTGTSMMMQMIEAGGIEPLTDHLREADHDNPRGYYELEAVKRTRDDDTWVEAAAGKVVKVIYRLLYDLPSRSRYRVVFMRRALEEVLASQSTMLERRGESGADLPPERLRELLAREVEKAERWLADQPNFEVLYVAHRDVITDPATAAETLAAFLGDGVDARAMATVVDPSLARHSEGGRGS